MCAHCYSSKVFSSFCYFYYGILFLFCFFFSHVEILDSRYNYHRYLIHANIVICIIINSIFLFRFLHDPFAIALNLIRSWKKKSNSCKIIRNIVIVHYYLLFHFVVVWFFFLVLVSIILKASIFMNELITKSNINYCNMYIIIMIFIFDFLIQTKPILLFGVGKFVEAIDLIYYTNTSNKYSCSLYIEYV